MHHPLMKFKIIHFIRSYYEQITIVLRKYFERITNVLRTYNKIKAFIKSCPGFAKFREIIDKNFSANMIHKFIITPAPP